MRTPSTALALALAALGTACVSNARPAGTLFATTPPGARVVVDGADTGLVTPCQVDLADGSRHRISLELPGYEPAKLGVGPEKRTWWVTWASGNSYPGGHFLLPLFLPFDDLVLPYRRDKGPRPQRVHFRLRPGGAG